MVVDDILIPALIAGVTAAIYGGYAYLTGKLTTPGEPFVPEKLIGTVIVSFGVGIAMSYAGMPIEQASFYGVLITIGAVEAGQKIVKPFFNWLRKMFDVPIPTLFGK